MKKIAFVIGHHRFSKGAYSEYYGLREYDFYKQFEDTLKMYGDVFYHNPLKGYNSRQKAMAKRTKDYDIVFELHFNAANGNAEGCEALYWYNNLKTKAICEKFCKEYTHYSKTHNRGAKALSSKSQRGYGFVFNQKAPAIILEPFFGDDNWDAASFSIHKMIVAINKALI